MNLSDNYVEVDLGNVCPNLRGTYNDEDEYEYLDMVEYASSTYMCRVHDGTIRGIAPTRGETSEEWQLATIQRDVKDVTIVKELDDDGDVTLTVEDLSVPGRLIQLPPAADGGIYYIQKDKDHYVGPIQYGGMIIVGCSSFISDEPDDFSVATFTVFGVETGFNHLFGVTKSGRFVIDTTSDFISSDLTMTQEELDAILV